MNHSISLNVKYSWIKMNCKKWNFEVIGNSVNTTEYLALGKALLARLYLKVEVSMNLPSAHNLLCLKWNNFEKNRTAHKFWRYFRNQTIPTVPFCTKFTFDNSNSPCLEQFLFYPDNCLVTFQILSYRELNVAATISFFFHWLSNWLYFWNILTVETFSAKQSVGFLLIWAKSHHKFAPLKEFWKKLQV